MTLKTLNNKVLVWIKIAVFLLALFSHLKQLESSGLPAFQAFMILTQAEIELKKPFAIMQQHLEAGRPISEAGFKSGIFNETHKTLIHAAETNGQLAEVCGKSFIPR